MEQLDAMWVVLCAVIVLEMQAGFLCLEAGTVRTKNAGNVALKNISDFCFVGLLYWLVGYGLMHGPEGTGWFSWGSFAPDFEQSAPGENAFFLFQMAFAATAATIVSGAVAERERFKGYVLLSILLGGLAYPVAGHWIWGGSLDGSASGWLATLGFIDFAGATAVHAVGGWAALCAILVLGPRLGRFGGKRRRFEEHSVTLATLGTLLLWIGWSAFNGGSALIFDHDVASIIIFTMLTAASGGLTAIGLTCLLDRHLRVDRVLNGALAGLVAGTAGVHVYGGLESIAAGIAGALAMVVATELFQRARIDDVVGAVPVHLAAGVVGTLIVALLAPMEVLVHESRLSQLRVQALGSLVVGLWVVGLMLPAAMIMKSAGLLRAPPREEVLGLNLSENNQSNAFQDLLDDMASHSRARDFSRRVRVERSSKAGAVAMRYNRVLETVDVEMTARKRAVQREQTLREQALYAARHDRLTGLGNRTLLEELHAQPATRTLLVAALDLDRFKDANDAYGHEAGDQILTACARRLEEFVTVPEEFALRIGGDEFVLFLALDGATEQASFICDEVLEQLIKPIPFASTELRVGCSIGFSICQVGSRVSTAVKQADLALYEAKRSGRNRVVAFDARIGAMHDDKMLLIEDFKRALENDEFSILLQPQVNADDGRLSGLEALVRWDHPTRGQLRPDTFLPIATELKSLGVVDARVLGLALSARRHIEKLLGYAPDISVNVSARRLLEPDLIDELRSLALPRGCIAFEILETAFLDDKIEQIQERIAQIKDLGIRIEIDDFGTGHASFASVLMLRPDRVKIDRMFADGVDCDPDRKALVSGIIEMAKTVSAEVVVEGVETEAQARVLSEVGANYLQGYYFARPLAMNALEAWINDHYDRVSSARRVNF